MCQFSITEENLVQTNTMGTISQIVRSNPAEMSDKDFADRATSQGRSDIHSEPSGVTH